MKSKDLSKAISYYSFTLISDFTEYFQSQPGKGHFTPTTFEEIQGSQDQELSSDEEKEEKKNEGNQENAYDDEEFQLEVDQQPQQATISTIKTYQFNSGMFALSNIDKKLKAIESPPEIQIKLQDYYGHNSKYRSNCMILDEGCYCISIGCNIVVCPFRKQQKIKSKKMYQQHQYQICSLFYSKQHKYLISGSKGLKPEIIIWSYEPNPKFQQCTLNFVNRFHLPRKSQAVGILQLISENIVLCIDSISLHRGNSLYMFDIDAGNQYKPSKKLEGKIYSMCVIQKRQVLFGSDEGIYKLNSIQDESVEKFYNKKEKVIGIAEYKSKVVIGDEEGTIQLISNDGKLLHKIKIHQSWVYQMKIIPKSLLLVSSQTSESTIKISKITENKEKISLQAEQTLKLSSYCISIDCVDSQNILIALRDGTVLLYDASKKEIKYEKPSLISFVQTNQQFLTYNKISEKIILLPQKDTIYQICPQNTSTLPQCLAIKLQKPPRCLWWYNDKVAKVYCLKDNRVKIEINSIIDIKVDPKKQIQISYQKAGKPKIVRFNEEIMAIGTKQGFLIVHCLKNSITLVSQQSHNTAVEDIIFQESPLKQNQLYYIKSVCKSELFYWQLQLFSKQPKIRKISKATPVKNLTWCSICKYGWQTRNIWEQMTHYNDINCVALVDGKYLCISMWNGALRVYRYPATKNNYKEYKLFSGKFKITACGKKENILACESNCCIMFVKFI